MRTSERADWVPDRAVLDQPAAALAGPAPAEETVVSGRAPRRDEPLTEREQSVLEFISQGMSNPAIGQKLFLTEDTIKTHVYRLMIKLGARNRAHAVARGFELGLLGQPRLLDLDPVRVPREDVLVFVARWRAVHGEGYRTEVCDGSR